MQRLAEIMEVYLGSDARRTEALYAELNALGPTGAIAMNLFRATKASERAKVYRGGRFKRAAYDKKAWSLDNAVTALLAGDDASLRWGWGLDPRQEFHKHVLYVDLPTGQISFHGEYRGKGPDYPGQWDGKPGQAADRITRWAAQLLEEAR